MSVCVCVPRVRVSECLHVLAHVFVFRPSAHARLAQLSTAGGGGGDYAMFIRDAFRHVRVHVQLF